MIGQLEHLARRGLFLFDPEAAHGLSIKALKSGLVPSCAAPADPRLGQTVAGLVFPTRSAWLPATTRMPKSRKRC